MLMEMIMFSMAMTVTAYWLSSSLILQLSMMVVYIIINSSVIYLMSCMPMISYLMLFSVISGLIVVLSFVMMSEPNLESTSISNKTVFMIFAPMVLIISMTAPLEFNVEWSETLVGQFSFFSSFSTNYYLMVFVFMALILLLMLFVVDLILTSYGGSMLPMK